MTLLQLSSYSMRHCFVEVDKFSEFTGSAI